jgi:hypothetical protein
MVINKKVRSIWLLDKADSISLINDHLHTWFLEDLLSFREQGTTSVSIAMKPILLQLNPQSQSFIVEIGRQTLNSRCFHPIVGLCTKLLRQSTEILDDATDAYILWIQKGKDPTV